MNKFFQNSINSNHKDNLVKKSIITNLSNYVKEIQYCGVEDLNNSIATTKTDISEACSSLCTVVEAIFLHGLKDSLTRRFRKVIADIDERPEPSFWAPLLVITHRQIIEQIMNLSQISTEIGQCRAWIRLALNDCLLSSYFITIQKDSRTIKSFYNISAFLRDSELLEVAQRLIEGLEPMKTFNLPCNSSLLNIWPLPSLFLAGIWAPTLKTAPVAPCDDVAQAIDEAAAKAQANSTDNSETCSVNSVLSSNFFNTPLRSYTGFDEDEALKIILAKEDQFNDSGMEDKLLTDISENEEKVTNSEEFTYIVGNSLNQRTCWSSDENQQNALINIEFPNTEILNNIDNVENHDQQQQLSDAKLNETSFHSLLESYSMFRGGYIKTPHLKEVKQKIDEANKTIITNNNMDEKSENIQVNDLTSILMKNETASLAIQYGQIAKETGLDKQNFQCIMCKKELSLTQKLNVCSFTGEYYCNNCMSEYELPIPARIIHNWDFKSYPVSKKAYNYINEVKDHPIIDFKTMNPYIYNAVHQMADLQILRNQLNYIRAYLYTCREPIIEQLKKKMWPKEYMYEHIHQYSLADLNDVTNGVLIQHLRHVVKFGKNHIKNCWLCSQKGFFCEICKKPKALFPFDIEDVYRCNECNAVYHKGCLNSSKPCPKCKRRKKREDLSYI